MRRWTSLAICLVACTARGPDREGAVAVTAHVALRPAADGEPWVRDIADAIAREQEQHTELRADGSRALPGVPHIEVEAQPISSNRFAPIPAVRIAAASREVLRDAMGRARAGLADAGDIVPIYEHVGEGWELQFVHTSGGFELALGAMAKLEPSRDGESPAAVCVFLADEDRARFEQLTRDHVGRRIAVVSGDESLMIPQVEDAVPGGVLCIAPGDGGSAETLLARLVQ